MSSEPPEMSAAGQHSEKDTTQASIRQSHIAGPPSRATNLSVLGQHPLCGETPERLPATIIERDTSYFLQAIALKTKILLLPFYLSWIVHAHTSTYVYLI